MHGSPALEFPPGLCVSATPSVGKGMNVLVGTGVFAIVAVGGIDVAVGMAAWVSAMIVEAAEIAVTCRSTGLIVGAASGEAPHALTINVIVSI